MAGEEDVEGEGAGEEDVEGGGSAKEGEDAAGVDFEGELVERHGAVDDCGGHGRHVGGFGSRIVLDGATEPSGHGGQAEGRAYAVGSRFAGVVVGDCACVAVPAVESGE